MIKSDISAGGNQAPVASFTYYPEVPMPDELITFNASTSHDPDGQIVQYSWNFGDGNTTAVAIPTIVHAYPVDGNYTIELTVIDNGGLASSASAVIQVNCEVFFRVCVYGTLTPIAGVKVTVYYNNGAAWVKAPAGSNGIEIRYDNMTQPYLADTAEEKYRNPGFTASILRCSASNIGFDFHQPGWTVFFKFEWGPYVTCWPNDTTKVYNYNNGAIEMHNYSPYHRAYWSSAAGTYVIKVSNIAKDYVNPTASHPIIVGILCPPPPQKYYLTVRTDPSGITTIPGEGWYNSGQYATLTAPQYVNVSGDTRYAFSFWDVDGASQGAGVNPITVCMNANHTATAHYIQQYLVTFTHSGLSSDATGTVVTVDGSSKLFSDLPFEEWVDSGGSVAYSYTSMVSSSVSGKRYRLNSVSGPSTPITVSGPATVTGVYCVQYSVTFSHTGLDSAATETIVTVNGSAKTYADLPYTIWVDSGSSVTYSYNNPVSSSVSGKRFRLNSVSGPVSPITVTSSVTITGNYVVQYLVTFGQSGLDSTATGTVVTVNGDAKTYSQLPYAIWVDSGSSVTYSYSSIVSSSVSGKRFRLDSVNGSSSPITVTSAVTITGNYVSQYSVTFTHDNLDSTATGTVVTVNGNAKTYADLPYTIWVDSGSSVTYSYSSPVSSSVSGKRFRLDSVSGPSSPIVVSSSVTMIGNYVVQYSVTFDQNGLDSTATGTVVTVNGNAKTYADLPYTIWVDSGSSVTYSYSSPVSSSVSGKRFRLDSVSGLPSPIVVTSSAIVTGAYVTQYSVTFGQTGLDSTAIGTVVTVNGNTKAYGDLPFIIWVDSGSSATYSYNDPVSSSISGKRFRLASVSGPSSPITVTGQTTVTGVYCIQYSITFDQTGIDLTATGTVVTVNDNVKTYGDLPYAIWADSGSSVTYSYNDPVSSSISGKRFRLSSVSGSLSPITVSSPTTVTGNYVTQYSLTFSYAGLDSTATGTVATVNGNAKTYSDLPYTLWVDSGSSVTYSYSSSVSSSVSGKRFRLDSASGPSSPIVVAGSATVTGNYVTQYSATFSQSGLDSTATGAVVTVNGNSKTYSDLPYTVWVDSGSSVTYSYSDPVLSIISGKKFKLTSVSGPSSPITITSPVTVTGNYKIQYQVTFDQTGVGTDFTGTLVTIDSVNYNVNGLPVQFWWDKDSSHSFAFASPLTVNVSKQYIWSSTSGLSTLQSGTLTITTSGSVTGNYVIANSVTFDQTGISSDFTGTVIIIDGTPYGVSSLPVSFIWQLNTTHSFSFQSPLVVVANSKRYVWTSTTGLSTLQSATITVTTSGNIIGNYKTQFYLTLATSPSGVASPSGAGWYDANAYASISTPQYVDIVSGSSRYEFSNWTTADMSEIANPYSPITTVLMDKAKTVTANYVIQYYVTFGQSGVSSDFTGTVVTIDGVGYTVSTLPVSFWWNKDSSHSFTFASPLTVNASKQYVWASTTGLSTLQSGTLPVTTYGSITGNYATAYRITFDQSGVGSDFAGTIVVVDSTPYSFNSLPASFMWQVGSSHTFDFASPLSVNGKRYAWTSTTGLSNSQSGSITVSCVGNVIGNYKTQYYLTLDTSPSGVASPSGAGWYDANAYASISTPQYVDIVSGSSRYKFNNWTTADMVEITNQSSPSTTVLMDKSKTVTANYVTQYRVTFGQSGVGSDFTGTVVTVDSIGYTLSNLPASFWWDKDSSHSLAFGSPLIVDSNKHYIWTSTSGLSTLQSETLTITNYGSVTGNYATAYRIIFDQLGVGSDFTGTIATIDSADYGFSSLPASFMWQAGSSHTFGFVSPLVVNGKRCAWTSTTGLSTSQSGSITVSAAGGVTGNYKTQFYLTLATNYATLATNPLRIASLTGAGWYDANTYASISAPTYIDIISGSSRYRFNNWTTADMSEITNPSSPSTTVLMDKEKTVTANYVVQYCVTFDQSGVNSDFTGTVVTVDSTSYIVSTLPASFWWDKNSSHNFAFASPLTVNISREYVWTSTTGLSILQGGTLTVTNNGSVTGNYAVHLKYQITFGVTGLGGDVIGTIVTIDGFNYGFTNLPASFWWDAGSNHAFSFVSVIDVGGGKRYVWDNTTGLSNLQNETITVSVSGSIIAHYKTQYYLTLATNPPGVTSPSGSGWYDANTYATISTQAFVDIVPGSSRYRFNGWTTPDMTEITDPTRSPTTVLMDKPKTVTAHYATQYQIAFAQSGIGSDFTGPIIIIDGVSYTVSTLPASFWWDKDSIHTFAYSSPLVVTVNSKQYVWTSTTGLSTLQSGSLTVSSAGTVIGNYKTQYYLTVSSPYDSPTPTSDWFDSGASITASVSSPVSGPTDTRYVCTGWNGTGSVPPSGSGTSTTFTITQASSITWNWKTQYKLKVYTDPQGLTPEPTRNPPGEPGGSWWYDASTSVVLTAQQVTGYTLTRWDVDGVYQDIGVNPITVAMDAPHSATAHYVPPPLSVTVSPLSSTINVGQSVQFSASPHGGASPYSYQWYLNGTLVPGATSATWLFTPSATGTYNVYVIVTDSLSNTAQSETVQVFVINAPVGGYSISLARSVSVAQSVGYMMLIALFGAVLTILRRKRK